MKLSLKDPLQGWEAALALLALLFPVALLAARLWLFPGWDHSDEAVQLQWLQYWREGQPPPLYCGSGSFHRGFYFCALKLLGWNLGSLRSAALLVFFAESLALALLAARLFSERAALWALAVNGFSALTAFRIASLLSFQMVPLEWLLLALLIFWGRSRAAAMAWGFACALLWLDYEGWPLAWPGLFLLAYAQRRPSVPWRLAGLGLGAAAALAIGADHLQSTLAIREASTLPMGWGDLFRHFLNHGLDFFARNGRALPAIGVPDHAQFPAWALPSLAAAAFFACLPSQETRKRSDRMLCLAALLPFASLALRDFAPDRFMAAWPALCLLCGAALARLASISKKAALALALLALGGGAIEARNTLEPLKEIGQLYYGTASAELAMAQRLKGQGPLQLMGDLDSRSHAELRFALGLEEKDLQAGKPVVFVPWQIQPALAADWRGHWEYSSSGVDAPQLCLFFPDAAIPQAEEADQVLGAFWKRTAAFSPQQLLAELAEATRQPQGNPLLRDALWEARFDLARQLGQAGPNEGRKSIQLGMLRVDPVLREARARENADPEGALALYRDASRRDPRRRESWKAQRMLLLRLGRSRELEALDKKIDALPENLTFEPEWQRKRNALN
jgi:hypothetical protein